MPTYWWAALSRGRRLRMEQVLDSARFRPPHVRGYVVSRPNLQAALDGRTRALLTLAHAPAGYGKTILLTERYRVLVGRGEVCVWVSLDDMDADPQTLLTSIVAASGIADARYEGFAAEFLKAGGGSAPEMVLSALMNVVDQVGVNVTLFLEDFHTIENVETISLVEVILKYAPANFCLVVSSRSVPDLNIAALKVRDQVVEMSARHLRFSESEAREFLGDGYGLTVDQSQLGAIHRYTDGWAIGLQVAAIASSNSNELDRFIENFTAGNADVMEFLARDVIGNLSDSTKKFLGDTADLDLLVPELCDVVTESSDSDAKLEELVRLNLFLQPVGEEAGWYRYHHLFRDFLKQHFRADEATSKRRHALAHGWYCSKGLDEQAINHALRAELWEEAAIAMESVWRSFLSLYRIGQLEGWIRRLPERIVSQHPELRIALAWTLLLGRRVGDARKVLKTLDVPTVRTDEGREPLVLPSDPLELETFLLDAAIDYVADDIDAIAYLSELDMTGLERLSPFHQGILLDVVIYAHIFSGSMDKASRLAEFATNLQLESQNFLGAIYASVLKGVGYNISGDLDAARSTFLSISELATENFQSDFPMPHAFLAEIDYERNDLDAAEAQLQLAAGTHNRSSAIDAVIAYFLTNARHVRARHGAREALEVLAKAEIVGKKEGHKRLLVHALAERVVCLASLGRRDDAAAIVDELDQITQTDKEISHRTWPRLRSQFVRAKALVLSLEGQIEEARSLLAPFLVEAEAAGRVGALIKFLLSDARALAMANKEDRAIRQLAKAISRAAPGRYLRVFLDQLWGAEDLVRETIRRIDQGRMRGISPVPQVYLAELASVFDLELRAGQEAEVSAPIEPLTAREKTLLLALKAGKTNKQIAHETGITQNTVAWHLKNLFAKLNVNNRTAAANAAQFLDLAD